MNNKKEIPKLIVTIICPDVYNNNKFWLKNIIIKKGLSVNQQLLSN